MEFVPYRVLRNQRRELCKRLEERGELVVTVDGEPMTIMLHVQKDSVEMLTNMLSQVRGLRAVAVIHEQARQSGLERMTSAEINEIIREI